MKTAFELRRFAATCRALAHNAVRDEDRRLLQEMAQTWMLLADSRDPAPVIAALAAAAFGFVVNLGQAGTIQIVGGRLRPWHKMLFLLADAGLGWGVYAARVASALAAQALSAAIIEGVLSLVNTSIQLVLAEHFVRVGDRQERCDLADQAAVARLTFLNDSLRCAAEARQEARSYVDAVGRRELTEHWLQMDGELVKFEAQIGHIEAARDNLAASMSLAPLGAGKSGAAQAA